MRLRLSCESINPVEQNIPFSPLEPPPLSPQQSPSPVREGCASPGEFQNHNSLLNIQLPKAEISANLSNNIALELLTGLHWSRTRVRSVTCTACRTIYTSKLEINTTCFASHAHCRYKHKYSMYCTYWTICSPTTIRY